MTPRARHAGAFGSANVHIDESIRAVVTHHLNVIVEHLDTGDVEHGLYSPPRGRHVHVELSDGSMSVMSIRRVAWILAHPTEELRSDEDIVITCRFKGDHNTGEGCCINHLEKVARRKAA